MDIIRLLKQAGIISGVSLLGEILHVLIHFRSLTAYTAF